MIETEVYNELNVFGPDSGPTPDLIGDAPPPPNENKTRCCGLMKSRPRSRVCSHYSLLTVFCFLRDGIFFCKKKHLFLDGAKICCRN